MGNKNIQFQESLNKNIQNNSFFNSADWRNYFTKMAGRESSYRSDAYNPSGAYGYFQLMPYNRRGKDIDTQFNDVFDLTQQHLQQLSANMTEQDYRKAEQYGIDMYGLAAGAHLGGPGGVLRVLRGKGNPKDSNGTSVLQYMQEFSGTQDPNNVIYGDLNEYFAQPQEELNYEIPDIQSSTEEDQNVLNADLDGLDDWINYIINVERKTPEYKQKLYEYNEAIARYKALGGPINTNNPIQNFSQFKGQLPIVRYSYGGELDNSIIPSSNSVKPNLFYDGGDTMTSQFLDQVLADREANQLRNEELAAQYNFSPFYDGYTEASQQMNNSSKPNIFRRSDGSYFYSADGKDEVDVTPVNTLLGNPSEWTYTDDNGRLYTPKSIDNNNQGVITQGNNEGPIVSAVNNYLRELQYKWDNNIPIDGKYTIPAIAATAALPLLGEAAYPILTNPYVDAGITSAFGAHGLNHAINEGVDGYGDAAMTALEISPLGRVIRPMFNKVPNIVKPLTNRINWLYNDGNIFNTPMRYTPNNYYREVSKEAIDDAVNSGVVRTGNPNKHIGPYFGKGNTPWHRKNYIIEGYPENNEWIYAIPYENAYRVSLESPTEGRILIQRALSKRVPTAANYVEAFPYTNGSINTTPTTNFSYWRKYPLLGWRKHSFVNVKTPTITAENAASITPEQWTAAQDAAIARGDMAEAQRLRDLHGNIHGYNIRGSHASKVSDNFTEFNTDLKIKGTNKAPTIYNDSRDVTAGAFFGDNSNGVINQFGKPRDFLLKIDNPLQVDAYGMRYNRLLPPGTTKEDIIKEANNLRTKGYTEDQIDSWIEGQFTSDADEYALKVYNGNVHDGAIIKNVYEGHMNPVYMEDAIPTTDYIITKPSQAKSADAVTFDDNGIRIPLGKRDNFNRNDIRYGFIPPVAAGLGLSLYNQDNQMQHSLGGHLNKFEEGGNTDDIKYQAFLEDLKNYAPNLAAPSKDYNMRRYWELRGKPSNWSEAQRDFNYLYNVKEDPMFTLEDDGFYHAHSAALNQNTGIIEFMKSADHPTVKYELNWYDNGDETGPNGLRIPSFEGFKSSQNFKQNYELKYSPIENKYYYIPKQR